MAEVHVKYDTKSKQMACAVDGKPVGNLHHVAFSKSHADDMDGDGGGYSMGMSLYEKKKDGDHGTVTHTHQHVRAEDLDAVLAQATAAGEPAAKPEPAKPAVADQIAAFLRPAPKKGK